MGYKWKPSKSQKREFTQNMQDVSFAKDYYERKELKKEKKRVGSSFDYYSAGGEYIPTKIQNDMAFIFLGKIELTKEEKNACNMIISGYACNEKVHHDFIHIVNELIRLNGVKNENIL